MSPKKFEFRFWPSVVPLMNKDKIWIGFTELIGLRNLHKEKPGIKRHALGSNELGKASKLKDTNNKFREEELQKIRDVKDEGKDGGLKKVFMKEWSEQSPAWFTRSNDETQYMKQMEVLQRFSTRYKNEYGSPDNATDQSVGGESKESNKKKLLKMMDKSTGKNYGTFVTALALRRQSLATTPPVKAEKRSLNPIETRTAVTSPQEVRTFLTLSNETPYVVKRTLSTSLKKKPIVKEFVNPDGLQAESVYGKRVKPKLYTIINPNLRNKEFEEYLKSISHAKKRKSETLSVDPTVGEYFTGRYSQDKSTPSKRSSESLTKGLKDNLVEGRRAYTIKNERVTSVTPLIHARTSLQVKATDLPLQLCKNMKAFSNPDSSKQEYPISTKNMSTLPKAETDLRSGVDDSLLNKIIKYFKR